MWRPISFVAAPERPPRLFQSRRLADSKALLSRTIGVNPSRDYLWRLLQCAVGFKIKGIFMLQPSNESLKIVGHLGDPIIALLIDMDDLRLTRWPTFPIIEA